MIKLKKLFKYFFFISMIASIISSFCLIFIEYQRYYLMETPLFNDYFWSALYLCLFLYEFIYSWYKKDKKIIILFIVSQIITLLIGIVFCLISTFMLNYFQALISCIQLEAFLFIIFSIDRWLKKRQEI